MSYKPPLDLYCCSIFIIEPLLRDVYSATLSAHLSVCDHDEARIRIVASIKSKVAKRLEAAQWLALRCLRPFVALL